MIDQTISHYKVVGELGAGGMGSSIAPKTSGSAAASRSSSFRRLGRADKQARGALRARGARRRALNHPHICTIYDIGEHEGHPFIAMELLEGSRSQR